MRFVQKFTFSVERSRMAKNFIIDDGFRPDLVEKAIFDGCFEIPTIRKHDEIRIPEGLIPFSARNRSESHREFIVFYEFDKRFAPVLIATDKYLDELKSFPGVVSPDCSLYWDMPLTLQIANVYMNRAVGSYLQSEGIYVIPNVRWGDERTYTTCVLPEKVAFLGVEKHSIVCIGTYGCVSGKENKKHFRAGLIAMLEELEPEVVLVYGPMPDAIFEGLTEKTRFVHYPDWITLKRKKVQ